MLRLDMTQPIPYPTPPLCTPAKLKELEDLTKGDVDGIPGIVSVIQADGALFIRFKRLDLAEAACHMNGWKMARQYNEPSNEGYTVVAPVLRRGIESILHCPDGKFPGLGKGVAYRRWEITQDRSWPDL